MQKDLIEAVNRLKNARLELELLREHEDGRSRTYHALAIGVLDNALNYLLTGKIYIRQGLHTAILWSSD